jgi:hypothetical protein
MSDPNKPTAPEDSREFPTTAAKNAVVKNWKTTSVGVLLAVTGFIAYSPKNFGGDQALIVELSKYIHMGGLAALGVVAKDYNVTGKSGN